MNSQTPIEAGRHDGLPQSLLLAILVLAVAATLRIAASLGDLWLDEIWTLSIVAQLSSAVEILTRLRDENNHILNTWFVYLLGPEQDWLLYRLPSVLAGLGTVWCAGSIGRRRSDGEGLLAMILTAGSYLLVHYSSEARGYSLVLFFAVLSFDLFERGSLRPSWKFDLLFAVAVIAGFLSQAMFVYYYAAVGGWSLWHLLRPVGSRPQARSAELRRLIRCHALPILFGGAYYLLFLRHLVNAGGPVYRLEDVVVETLSLTLGGPPAGAFSVAIAIGAVAVFCTGLILLRRQGDDRWLFYLGVIVAGPALLMLITRRNEVYVRYFLLAVVFFLLLASQVCCWLWRRGGIWRWLAAVLVTGVLVGNGVHISRLIEVGRGGYLAALRYMEEQTIGPTLTLASDHDFRNGMVIAYYAPFLGGEKPLQYFPAGQWSSPGPEWVLKHEISQNRRPPPEFRLPDGTTYRLVREYPYAGLSGWSWWIYHRKSAT